MGRGGGQVLVGSRIWLNKIPGQTKTEWPATNPMAKLGFRVPIGAPKCSCSSLFRAADGPRAQLLTRLAESSAAPGAARSRGSPRGDFCACGGSRPGVLVCAELGGQPGPAPGVALRCGRAPAARRGTPASDSSQRLLRSGEAEVLQDPLPSWDSPVARTLVGVRARGPGRRCPREAPHGKRWTTRFRDKVASKLGFGANSWEEGVGLAGKEKGQVGLVFSVWNRRSGLRGSGHRE